MYVNIVPFKRFQLGLSPLDRCLIHEIAKQTLCGMVQEFHLLSLSSSSLLLPSLSLSFQLVKGTLDLILDVLSPGFSNNRKVSLS